jgi:CO/xanthine dehydrogenase Mo-binding subunit
MSVASAPDLSRRGLLTAGGALVVAFTFARPAVTQEGGPGPKPVAPGLPGSLKTTPFLDAWIRVDAEGRITVFTGKAELGQGIRTALIQVAAEELDVAPARLTLITADTGRTPNEGLTAGSHSMQDSGSAIRNAAANVRHLLAQAAAERWGVSPDAVATTGDGRLKASDGRTLGYGALAAGLSLHVEARADAPLRHGAKRAIGLDLPRIDIPAKVSGGQAYVQDLRLPGMLHARVVRGPSAGTRLNAPDFAGAKATPGIVAVVRNGAFAAVVAEREWTAVQVLQRLQQAGWSRADPPIPVADPYGALRAESSQDEVIFDAKAVPAPAAKTVRVRYTKPWLLHGSIGPSCAVALFQDGVMIVWTHTQGVFPLRRSLADLLHMPLDKVRCIHTEGSGCYGHNGADDVAGDAALCALALPGRPIRMQWMREQEHGWEPTGTGMVVEAEATLDASSRIASWHYEVWSPSHNGRPESGGGLLAGLEVDPPFPPQIPKPIPMPEGGGDRNAVPIYQLPSGRIVSHFIARSPVRVSALRSLGGYMNVFSVESLMDELSRAGGVDPVAFRLSHLADPRAIDVVNLCATKFGWTGRPRGDGRVGCGFAFARYKNLASYCAVAMEVAVEHETGAIAVRRVVSAVDSGEAVNPNGIRNQIEGAIVQSLSWTGIEAVTFDAAHRTSFDWSGYPIARFQDVPGSVEVHVLDRTGQPFLGAGEAGQGPAGAALANAVADATGVRFRDLPLSPDRVKAGLGV